MWNSTDINFPINFLKFAHRLPFYMQVSVLLSTPKNLLFKRKAEHISLKSFKFPIKSPGLMQGKLVEYPESIEF